MHYFLAFSVIRGFQLTKVNRTSFTLKWSAQWKITSRWFYRVKRILVKRDIFSLFYIKWWSRIIIKSRSFLSQFVNGFFTIQREIGFDNKSWELIGLLPRYRFHGLLLVVCRNMAAHCVWQRWQVRMVERESLVALTWAEILGNALMKQYGISRMPGMSWSRAKCWPNGQCIHRHYWTLNVPHWTKYVQWFSKNVWVGVPG
jgi:hypothetical protein